MIKIVLTLLFICSYSMANAEVFNVKLIGKGIMDRRTHEVAAFQCVGEVKAGAPSCDHVQLIKLESNGASIALGPAHEIRNDGVEPVESELKKFLVQYSNKFKAYKSARTKEARGLGYTAVGVSSGLGIMVLNGGHIITPKQWMTAIGALGVEAAFMYLACKDKTIFPQVKFVSVAFDEKQGWNWSEKPKKISHHSFKMFIDFASS